MFLHGANDMSCLAIFFGKNKRIRVVAETEGLTEAPAPARKIFSRPSPEIFSLSLKTKSQKENPPCNII
jgi:hypothetical protein